MIISKHALLAAGPGQSPGQRHKPPLLNNPVAADLLKQPENTLSVGLYCGLRTILSP